MSKLTKVKLVSANGEKEFDLVHAEKILTKQAKIKRNDWKLTDKHTFEDGKIVKARNTAEGKEEKKEK